MRKTIILLLVLSTPAFAQDTLTTSGGITSMSSATVIAMPDHHYTYDPQPDITAPELATILKVLLPALACRNVLGNGCDILEAIDNLPSNVKRHFTLHKDR
jgi:hypothetical protein